MTPRLQEKYQKQWRIELMKERNYRTIMQVPRLEKIVLNVGIGDAHTNPKALESAMEELALITGQKPIKTVAKKSIAGFKIREGMAIGTMVTLRGRIMYEFLDRLLNFALPRVRDFRGLSRKSFDKFGNYNFSIKEQIIFPEINFDNVDQVRGINITIVTTARTAEESTALLEKFNVPFRKN